MLKLKLKFEPRDLWVGVYWNLERCPGSPRCPYKRFSAYVCLVPCLPLRFSILLSSHERL